tara:strand:+ start:572 stop:814 length:243 start_codon:yes stop_codon:yes gene_type:complete
MGLVERVFAPLPDHEGRGTPSRAARWWLWIVLIPTAVWAWRASEGAIVPTLVVTTLVATLALPVGWWVLSLVASTVEKRT